MAKEEKAKEEAPASGGSMKMIVIVLVVLLLVVIGAGVALFMMMGDKTPPPLAADGSPAPVEEVATPKVPVYVPLHPAFLVNFEDQSSASHLQVDVQVMTYDEKVAEALKIHMPKIRNDLILLFGSQKYEELNTMKGKKELSKKSIEVVEKALKDAGEAHKIEAFLFTSFVMQ
ncbi:MAG: flagellar basal body-associated FliL family protein [Gammaproteobacteria bacterium]|nr:flagellar basal body-associated FliL family protein [Gammaproteobacteria bacterium]